MKKTITMILSALMMITLLAGCMGKEAQYTTDLKNDIMEKIGLPDVDTYFEYSQLKEIYEIRDNPNLVCYWYTKNEYTGKWIYQGVCVGYGIPYGASITAPDAYQYIGNGAGHSVLPMAEPNGLYTGSVVTTATWILSSVDGDIKPMYVESEIMVSQTKIDARLCEDWSLTPDY